MKAKLEAELQNLQVPEQILNLLNEFVLRAREILSENLTGIYLHGSAVMGCFNPQKSDIDLIIVINDKIADETKRRFMNMIIKMNEAAPQKGIEMSIVLKSVCKPFVFPTPFELHFSNMHINWYKDNPDDYIQKMNGTDEDLAAHFSIIRKRGKCLYGELIENVFAEVPKQNYLDSISADIAEAKEDIKDNPTYVILNLTRVLAFKKDNLILSKKEGGEWALETLPEEYHTLLKDALKDYEGNSNVTYDMDCADKYADFMLKKII